MVNLHIVVGVQWHYTRQHRARQGRLHTFTFSCVYIKIICFPNLSNYSCWSPPPWAKHQKSTGRMGNPLYLETGVGGSHNCASVDPQRWPAAPKSQPKQTQTIPGYQNWNKLRTFKIEIPLPRSRTPSQVQSRRPFYSHSRWVQSRRLWLSSRWCSDNVTLEVSWSNSNATSILVVRKMISVQLFDELPPNYSTISAVFHLETCSEQAEKKWIFHAKSTEKDGQNRGPCGHRYRSWKLQTWRLLFETPKNQVSKHR